MHVLGLENDKVDFLSKDFSLERKRMLNKTVFQQNAFTRKARNQIH